MPTPTADAGRTGVPEGSDRVASGDSGPVAEVGFALEAQLVASGGGDAKAFADLYDSVAPRVHGLVLRLVRDVRRSEEVTHDVFLEIWRTSILFDPNRSSALSWVMTLAHRRAVDHVRRAGDRRLDADDIGRDHIHSEETGVPADASLSAQTVRAALAALSMSQRQAVELAYFGGYTHSETSELLQAPRGSAKTSMRDGLVQLRDILSPVSMQVP